MLEQLLGTALLCCIITSNGLQGATSGIKKQVV